MFVFQIAYDDMTKQEFVKMLCRNVANTMYRPNPDTYLVQMHADDLGLVSSDLNVNKNYRSLHKVKKVFSFNKTPTTSRLTRAVSSMISPLTSSSSHNQNLNLNRERIGSTPSGDLQNLKLQSCSNLLNAESPRSSRFPPVRGEMPPPSPSTR